MKLYSIFAVAFLSAMACACSHNDATSVPVDGSSILLKNFRPISVFKIEENHPESSKVSTIDMHSHVYRKTEEEIAEWDKLLAKNNVERVVIHTMASGDEFERLYDLFKGISDRFELWCGINYEAWGTPDFEKVALADLERCAAKGAKGVGELGDKGRGETFCLNHYPQKGIKNTKHFDNGIYDAIIEKCGELGLPISFHAADPIWMYLPMDKHNDGYMNAEKWMIDASDPEVDGFDEIIHSFVNAVEKHPDVTFIACHLLNLSHDYTRLGEILDNHPNLWIDISARHCETAATPRATKAFYEKYQDRILFGTDNDPEPEMYKLQWRVLQTADEHFYDDRAYHWALNGLDLNNEVITKLCHDNAEKLMASIKK